MQEIVPTPPHTREQEEAQSTKLLRLGPALPLEAGQKMDSLLFVARDNGGAQAMAPVARILADKQDNITFQVDEKAEEEVEKSFDTEDITPPMMLGMDQHMPEPQAVIFTPCMNIIESQALATFDRTESGERIPSVMIEDYYTSARIYLQAVRERPGLPLPEKICVLDAEAGRLLVEMFPDLDLESRIAVTGGPAFDKVATENHKEIGAEVREKLGLTPYDDAVVMMSSDDVSKEQVREVVSHMKDTTENFCLVFRRHPRDVTSYDEYFAMFAEMGIRAVDSRDFTTDQVSACADIVITTWSTEGLKAIYRGKPTIHLLDPKVLNVPENVQQGWPPVTLGASVGITNMDALGPAIQDLNNPKSDRYRELMSQMATYYPLDGKNADRVVEVIEGTMLKNESES